MLARFIGVVVGSTSWVSIAHAPSRAPNSEGFFYEILELFFLMRCFRIVTFTFVRLSVGLTFANLAQNVAELSAAAGEIVTTHIGFSVTRVTGLRFNYQFLRYFALRTARSHFARWFFGTRGLGSGALLHVAMRVVFEMLFNSRHVKRHFGTFLGEVMIELFALLHSIYNKGAVSCAMTR